MLFVIPEFPYRIPGFLPVIPEFRFVISAKAGIQVQGGSAIPAKAGIDFPALSSVGPSFPDPPTSPREGPRSLTPFR
jgi:hypothetical protein